MFVQANELGLGLVQLLDAESIAGSEYYLLVFKAFELGVGGL